MFGCFGSVPSAPTNRPSPLRYRTPDRRGQHISIIDGAEKVLPHNAIIAPREQAAS